MSYLDELNSQQKKAVLKTEGPLLILAGAGAGKTKTLTHRIAHLIKQGVEPRKILAVTFTNKAAKEMADRVDWLLKNDSDLILPISEIQRPKIKTFHALGVEILRRYADKIGFHKSFSIYDRNDSKQLIRQVIKDLDYDPKQIEPNKILAIISKNKNDLIGPQEFLDRSHNYFEQSTAEVWQEYENRLKKEKAFDFDDLLLKALIILQNSQEARSDYQNFFEYIHIDEYQDTNRIQYQITKILAEPQKNLCVVGDVDQNIYSWRGATIENILNFEKDYPETEIVLLEQNYRSTKNILEAANLVIAKNSRRKEKNLFTENPNGDPITLYEAIDEYDEARFAVEEIKKNIKNEIDYNNFAVLFRANHQSRVLEEVFLKNNIPHQVLGTRFFDRKEIKDILAFIKLALNEEDFSSLNRVINLPARGIGKATTLKIYEKRFDEIKGKTKENVLAFFKTIKEIRASLNIMKPSDLINFIYQKTGLEIDLKKQGEEGLERIENIKELVSLAKKYDEWLPEEEISAENQNPRRVEKMIEDAMLATDQDSLDEKINKKAEKSGVKLMTVHAAKGLEFDNVFIVGLEEGLFPHERLDEIKEDPEEERRLFYVAITRARKKLYLCRAVFRTVFGSKMTQVPSSFLGDIDPSLIENKSFNDHFLGDDFLNDEERPRKEWLIDF